MQRTIEPFCGPSRRFTTRFRRDLPFVMRRTRAGGFLFLVRGGAVRLSARGRHHSNFAGHGIIL
jgi:hypothetical protein